MRGLKLAGRIVSLALTVVLAVLLACNLYLIAARAITGDPQPTVFGYSSAVVVSGSMSGAIEINDMVICHREKSYAPGDVITFESGSSVVTHRIVKETEDGFVTKGDANNTADLEPVLPEQVIGRVVLVVPQIGQLIAFLKTPLGMTCLVLLGIVLIAFPTLTERVREKKTGGKNHGKHVEK